MVGSEDITGRIEASEYWVKLQSSKFLHWFAVVCFGVTIFAGFQSITLLFAGLIIFSLATSIPVMWRNIGMLIFCLILAGVCALIPTLAPIAILVMIALYIKRIVLVFENWRPILAGVIVYGLPLIVFSSLFGSGVVILGLPFQFIVCFAFMAGIHFLLKWQYKWNYDVPTALSLMGIVPLLILAFVLPFLKLHIGFDSHDISADTPHPVPSLDAHPVSVFTDTQAASAIVDAQAASTIAANGTPNMILHQSVTTVDTNLMHIDSVKAPLGYHIVHEYIQTNPDGIEANNLSHPGGPDPSAPPPSGVHIVHEHISQNPTS